MENDPGSGWETPKQIRENTLQELEHRREISRRRREYPFLRSLCKRLFVLTLLVFAGFGIFEMAAHANPAYQVAFSRSVGSVLGITAAVGVPLLALCGVQWVRIRKGRIQENLRMYKVFGLITAALLAFLLAAFLVALFAGA